MSFEVPEDCRYLETHEWVRLENGTARVGISDFAQDELGDVVFVELPSEGDSLSQEADFGVIESIKAVSDLYAPVSGTVAPMVIVSEPLSLLEVPPVVELLLVSPPSPPPLQPASPVSATAPAAPAPLM